MKPPYTPFPIGTVRGPYHHHGTVQFLVNGRNGWVPFQRQELDEVTCEKSARAYSRSFHNPQLNPTR